MTGAWRPGTARPARRRARPSTRAAVSAARPVRRRRCRTRSPSPRPRGWSSRPWVSPARSWPPSTRRGCGLKTGPVPGCCASWWAIRTPWLTDVANAIKAAGTGWGVTVLGASVIVLTMIFRRWRHLLVFMGSVLFLGIAGNADLPRAVAATPVRRADHHQLGRVCGGSPPVAVLTIFLMGIVYCLVVPGRPRTYTKARLPPWSPCSPWRACTWGSITPAMCCSARRSRWRSRSPRSVTSPRTRCSPSSTGAAAPPTWM